MAYYLQSDGTNDYVTVSMAATSAESWSLKWKLFAIPTPDGFGFARLFGGSAPNISNDRVSTQIGGGDVSTRFNGVTKIWSGLTFTNTDAFRITYNGAQLELFINDVSRGAIAGTVTANFQIIGANSNAYTNLALQYAKFTNTTTPSKSRDYQPSLSNGTGNSLPDAANSVNGNLVNFTAVDADKWKFYSAGTNYEIIPQPGSYTITGGAVSLIKNSRITPQPGSYALTGQAVGLLANRAILPQAGSFTLTGQSVQLIADRVIHPQSGSYVITGSAVDLIYDQLVTGYVITPEPGLFNIAGSDVDLIADRLIKPEAGNYQLFGSQIDLLYGRAVIPQAGAFAITGSSVDVLKDSMIIPQPGAYTITGNAVILDYSGFVRNSVYTIRVSYAVNTETIAYKTNNVLIYYKPIEE